MEYDPAVSTHKASSITSTTSTSSSSTWDHPISTPSYIHSQEHSMKPDDHLHHVPKFEEYQFDASLISERISIPSSYDYEAAVEQDSDQHRQQRKKNFSEFIDTFITADNQADSNMPDLITKKTNIKKENHEKLTGSHHISDQLNHNVTHDNLYPSSSSPLQQQHPAPIYLQHGDQITVPSISMLNNKKRSFSPAAGSGEQAYQHRPIRPSATATTAMHHHNSSRQRSDSVCSTNSTSKRSKLNRDLLTDDEKRVNHIASEQKRRNTIRIGFKDLTDIIPTLKNINNSKSTILFKAVEYIKHLDKRNRGLREKISSLQVRMKVEGRMAEQQQQSRYRSTLSHNNAQRYNKVFGINSNNGRNSNHDHHQSNQQHFNSSMSISSPAATIISSTSSSNHFSHLPAHTVSALLAHKNQQRQLEELQEQLRMQQQLLAKHNIVAPSQDELSLPIMTKEDEVIIQQQQQRASSITQRDAIREHNHYNSISIPSSRSSNSEENNNNNDTFHSASFIVPQDLSEHQLVHHSTNSVTTRRPWHH